MVGHGQDPSHCYEPACGQCQGISRAEGTPSSVSSVPPRGCRAPPEAPPGPVVSEPVGTAVGPGPRTASPPGAPAVPPAAHRFARDIGTKPPHRDDGYFAEELKEDESSRGSPAVGHLPGTK